MAQRETRVQTVEQLLAEADDAARAGTRLSARTWSTGFSPLDSHLGGGLRAGELILVGGPPGQGKTTFVLQMARACATVGDAAVYLTYEHPAADVLARLLAMEAGLRFGANAFALSELRAVLSDDAQADGGLAQRLAGLDEGERALTGIAGYAQRLAVLGASGRPVDLAGLRRLVLDAPTPPVLFVDYLQKVAVESGPADEAARVTVVAEALKDLALEAGVPIVAVVAADTGGASRRVRLQHLRGSSALAYEADVALMLNNKYDCVAREHLTFNSTNAERFRDLVICSMEKNRSGRDRIDLEFRARFDRGHFDPAGQPVVERLVDDRLTATERT